MDLGPRISSPMSPEAWNEVRGLSEKLSATAGGRFRLIEKTDDLETRRSLYVPCPDFEGAYVDTIASNLEDRYGEMTGEMGVGVRRGIIGQMATHLESGGNIAINMNHPNLIRSGIGFRLINKALEDRGVNFDKAVIGGAALLNLEAKLDDRRVPNTGTESPSNEAAWIAAYDAVGLISNHFFVSVPATERAEEFRTNYKEEVQAHNLQMKEKLTELLHGSEGILVLMLGSGTHDTLLEDDPNTIKMAPISPGTIEMIIENGLSVVQAAVSDLPGQPMSFYMLKGPNLLQDSEQMHLDMERTADFLSSKDAEFSYQYQKD